MLRYKMQKPYCERGVDERCQRQANVGIQQGKRLLSI